MKRVKTAKKLKVSKKAPTTKVKRKRKPKAATLNKEAKQGQPKKAAPLIAPVKRGRPKKEASPKKSEPTETAAPAKRGPGRPKANKKSPGRPKKILVPAPVALPKRGPGRPKSEAKETAPVKAEPKKSVKAAPTPKVKEPKKPGRPPKETVKTEPKKRGRPAKAEAKIEAKKPGRPKGSTKIPAKKALSRDKYKAAHISKDEFVAVKPWCHEHGISTRMAMAKIKKHGFETVKVRGKSTNNQVALGISLAQAETITKEIQHLEIKKDNEMTLTEIAKALNISERAARSRVQHAKIKGRMGRYSQEEKNPSKRNQPVTLYKAEVVAQLRKEDKVIAIA
jgi:hypothetical protein